MVAKFVMKVWFPLIDYSVFRPSPDPEIIFAFDRLKRNFLWRGGGISYFCLNISAAKRHSHTFNFGICNISFKGLNALVLRSCELINMG